MKLFTRRIPPRAAIAVGAAALVVSLVSGREKPGDPITQVERDARPASAAADLDLERLRRPAPAQVVADLFAAPPPPAAGMPPREPQHAVPAPPPLPFRYLGRAIEEGRTAVFLGRGNENFSVAQGERVGRDYRVDRITDQSVTLTYLPLGLQQSLPVPTLN